MKKPFGCGSRDELANVANSMATRDQRESISTAASVAAMTRDQSNQCKCEQCNQRPM